jgi:hypothetical protein
LSFSLQRFSLSGSEVRLTTSLPFMPFIAALRVPANRNHQHCAAAPRVYTSGESVSTSSVLPEGCRSILS